jgi:hypothetical protein
MFQKFVFFFIFWGLESPGWCQASQGVLPTSYPSLFANTSKKYNPTVYQYICLPLCIVYNGDHRSLQIPAVVVRLSKKWMIYYRPLLDLFIKNFEVELGVTSRRGKNITNVNLTRSSHPVFLYQKRFPGSDLHSISKLTEERQWQRSILGRSSIS